MATKQASLVHVDEDYIDMELTSSPNAFFSYSISSPPKSREFEFQMTSVPKEKESTTSPADELFYKGKLLPLHLPPRLQMVQKLHQNSNDSFHYVKTDSQSKDSSFRLTSTNASTPVESCNISPSESCRVSSEVHPDEYPYNWSTEINEFVDGGGDIPKKSWSKKLKQIKQFWLGQRLKASREYLKSLFNKSACSDKSCANAAANNAGGAEEEKERKSKCKECQNKYVKIAARKSPFEMIDDEKHHKISCAVMKSINREIFEDGVFNYHRKSFSGAIQRHSVTKTSSLSTSSSGSSSTSSSFSFSSSGFYDLQLFKRSSSANSELEEGSIEGAIAHCKKSQQQSTPKKTQHTSTISSQSVSNNCSF